MINVVFYKLGTERCIMKNKRITMIIEILLFIFGVYVAYYFGLTDKYDSKLSSLISNIFIGISTGGLVAFGTTLPSYINESKIIKAYFLKILDCYIFMYTSYLI